MHFLENDRSGQSGRSGMHSSSGIRGRVSHLLGVTLDFLGRPPYDWR